MYPLSLSIRDRSRRTKVLLAAGAATLLVATSIGVANAADRSIGALAVSKSADRTSPVSLARYKASGSIYVFLNRNNVSEVSFYLDDKTRTGAAYSTERFYAYDFAATNGDGTARPFDTKTIADGTHNITAVVKTTGGANRVFTANFTVQNSATVPTTSTSTSLKPTTTTTAPTPSTSTTTSTSTSTTVAPTSTTVAPTTSTTVKPTTTTTKPTTTTTPGTAGPLNTVGGRDPWGGVFPGPNNTGVPSGTTLTAYTGPCTITAANTVIDAKTINCDIAVRAANVTISRSKVNGVIESGSDTSKNYSFTVTDSEIDASPNSVRAATAVGEINFTVIRSHIYGGNRGAHCYNTCRITDSYFHGQDTDVTGVWHESGVRMGQFSTIRHNTIICDAPDVPPDAGCSASLTGYGDFTAITNNTIENNLFPPSTGGYCAYGGSSLSKPFSAGTRDIIFRNNVFMKGTSRNGCAAYGPITSFDEAAPGNIWSNNVWDTGGQIPASN